jgi:hypothetical protein
MLADITNSTQCLKNPTFDSNMQYWIPAFTGDVSDVKASIHSGQANCEILGEKRTFSLIADPPIEADWVEMDNPNFPHRPDLAEITSEGCRVTHQFNDTTAVQNPSVHWEQNITMPVDMTDYVIKSASIQAIINATVDENLDRLEDYLNGDFARLSPSYIVDTYSVGDYITFYVLISDLEKNKVYEIASFQTEEIGNGNPPGKDYLYDSFMITVPQDVLIFYIDSVLNTDNYNFTVSLGINLHVEDNLANYYDLDYFDELIIKFVNFTFTYEKKIDRFTSVSWNQKVSSISGTNIEIIDSILNFKYKVDMNWSESLSPNSEMRVLINNNEIEKYIKLGDFRPIYQDLNLLLDDLKSYILPNINLSLSIMIFFTDEFTLDQVFTFSIDDVYLTISYIIYTEVQFPFYIIWIILIILFVIIAILSSLSLRSYVLIPRKLKKRRALLSRTQKFKDADNIQGVLLIHNPSGLPIFSKNYSNLMEGKKTLFSGFLQAISLVSQEIINKDFAKSKVVRSEMLNGLHNILELDFKHFYCLISDIEELRTVLILKGKSSKRIKKQLLNFGLSVYTKFSEILIDWNHETNTFQEEIPTILDKFFDSYYKNFYKIIISKIDLEYIKKEFELSRTSFKILCEILSLSEKEHIFKLMSLLNKLSNKNKDLIIDTIDLLIQKKILIPANSVEFQTQIS